MVLMTEIGAAQYLGGEKPLSVKTLQRWRLDGKPPFYRKIGRLIRYDKDCLDQYLQDRLRRSTSEHSAEAAK
jgi:hypothetical protein